MNNAIDVSEYTCLKAKACRMYQELTEVRNEIKAMEQNMVEQMVNTQTQVLAVITDHRPAVFKLQNRTRRVALTQADLKGMLVTFLHQQFTTIPLEKMKEFAISLADSIWRARRVTQETRVVVKPT